jgi:hypothetical protein
MYLACVFVRLEARNLINTANSLSACHLRDSSIRMKFVQEIKEVILSTKFTVVRARVSPASKAAAMANAQALGLDLSTVIRLDLSNRSRKPIAQTPSAPQNHLFFLRNKGMIAIK